MQTSEIAKEQNANALEDVVELVPYHMQKVPTPKNQDGEDRQFAKHNARQKSCKIRVFGRIKVTISASLLEILTQQTPLLQPPMAFFRFLLQISGMQRRPQSCIEEEQEGLQFWIQMGRKHRINMDQL